MAPNKSAAANAATAPAPHSIPGTIKGNYLSAGKSLETAQQRRANGSLTNFFGATPARASTPTEALLKARAAVPQAGTIKGLGHSSRSRFNPLQFQPSRFPPKGASNNTAPREIGVRMSEKLALLAAQSNSKSEVEAKTSVTPPPAEVTATPARNAATPQTPPKTAPVTTLPDQPTPLPSAQIPNAMRDALDRYEQMKLQQRSPG